MLKGCAVEPILLMRFETSIIKSDRLSFSLCFSFAMSQSFVYFTFLTVKCLINFGSMMVHVEMSTSRVSLMGLIQLLALPLRASLKLLAEVSSVQRYVARAILILSNKILHLHCPLLRPYSRAGCLLLAY